MGGNTVTALPPPPHGEPLRLRLVDSRFTPLRGNYSRGVMVRGRSVATPVFGRLLPPEARKRPKREDSRGGATSTGRAGASPLVLPADEEATPAGSGPDWAMTDEP